MNKKDEANNSGLQTKRVGRGETVRFTYNMPTATETINYNFLSSAYIEKSI